MTPVEVMLTLAGLYVAGGLSYAVMAGATAGLRERPRQPDRETPLRELLTRLPAVISEVGPFDDIIDARQAPEWRAAREYPTERKPLMTVRRGAGR